MDAQVSAAEAERRWPAAWNQAAEAGAPRERLEAIALAALADDDGSADGMLEALREKWAGSLPRAGRA